MTDSSRFKEQFSKWRERQEARDHGISKARLKSLMENIDFEATMLRLGIEVKPQGRHEWRGMCPDHVQKCGRVPSDPNWVVNDETGLTFCFTEGRGSNIVEIAKVLWGLPTSWDAYQKLMEGASCEIKFDPGKWVREQEEAEEEKETEEEKLKAAIEDVTPILEGCCVSDQVLEYFERDGIKKSTLDKFGIVSADYGRYKDRAIVPFLGAGMELIGYIAIDTLGKERWAREHAKYHFGVDSSTPLEELETIFLKKYRKTLYCPGFQSRRHLYGFYENMDFLEDRKDTLLLVEGERDCLKMMQEGIPCLSVHGTYLKEDQLSLLREHSFFSSLKEVYLGFDMDEAGNEACNRSFNTLSKEIDFDKIFVLNFPPDENGSKRDPKKFSGEEIRELMDLSKKEKIRSR